MKLITTTSKNIFYFCAIILAGTILFKGENSPTTNLNDNLTKPPQEYMRGVEVTHFTEQGGIKDRILAKYWAYLPSLQLSQILEPRLSVVKPNNVLWHVNAKHGIAEHPTLESKVTRLELKNEVVVVRPEVDKTVPITVTTEQLFYYPDNEYVQTDRFVKMVKPGLEITGIGMEGYLDKNWVELQKDVKTTYVSTS